MPEPARPPDLGVGSTISAHVHANYFLQQVQDLALTPAGQDRARNRVVVLPPPDPDEDDGHDLSDLIVKSLHTPTLRLNSPAMRNFSLCVRALNVAWVEECLARCEASCPTARSAATAAVPSGRTCAARKLAPVGGCQHD